MSPIRKLKKVKETATEVVAKGAAALSPNEPENNTPSIPEGGVPKITNETITEHREQVLSGARKYIYPLAHSKRRIVLVTIAIVVAALMSLSVYCGLALYRYYQYNAFLYRVTQLVPAPIARIGHTYVAYENYLFNLRQYIHYYQTQQNQDFNNPTDKEQLLQFRKQALNSVIDQAYIKILAQRNNISVGSREVNQRTQLLRDQNRIGSSDKVFTDVLRDYYGWSISDFKRSLKDQILAERVTAALDKPANERANSALGLLKKGADFTDLAKKLSEDKASRPNGGSYGFAIDKNNPNVAPQVIEVLFGIKPGQVSGIIPAGTTLEIVKLNTKSGSSVTAQHISFSLKSISTYVNDLKAKEPPRLYVHF